MMPPFYFTSCGHLLCSDCIKSGSLILFYANWPRIEKNKTKVDNLQILYPYASIVFMGPIIPRLLGPIKSLWSDQIVVT